MPILQITYGFNGSDNRYGNWINVFPGEDTMWKINVFAPNDYPDGERHEMKYTADSDEEMPDARAKPAALIPRVFNSFVNQSENCMSLSVSKCGSPSLRDEVPKADLNCP